jgi:hypothetical protein
MSPLAQYFKGKGQKVMSDMQSRYGTDKGKQVFYATANKNPDMKPKSKRKSFGQRIAERMSD